MYPSLHLFALFSCPARQLLPEMYPNRFLLLAAQSYLSINHRPAHFTGDTSVKFSSYKCKPIAIQSRFLC